MNRKEGDGCGSPKSHNAVYDSSLLTYEINFKPNKI